MAAYVQLPWMPSSDMFLRAMEGGSRRANDIAQLQQQRARDEEAALAQRYANQARILSAGGGGIDPRAAAQAEALRSETRLAEESAAAQEAAAAENQRLIGLGATPQEAFFQTGLSRFGLRPPVTETDRQTRLFETGNQIVEIDPSTGGSRVVFEAPKTPPKEQTFNFPIMKNLGGAPSTIPLTVNQFRDIEPTLAPFARTNAIARAVMSLPQSGAARSENTTFSSEAEARQNGAKSGDIVVLKGIGKVRLR